MITNKDIERVQLDQIERADNSVDGIHNIEDYGVSQEVRDQALLVEQLTGMDADSWCSGFLIGLQLGKESQ